MLYEQAVIINSNRRSMFAFTSYVTMFFYTRSICSSDNYLHASQNKDLISRHTHRLKKDLALNWKLIAENLHNQNKLKKKNVHVKHFFFKLKCPPCTSFLDKPNSTYFWNFRLLHVERCKICNMKVFQNVGRSLTFIFMISAQQAYKFPFAHYEIIQFYTMETCKESYCMKWNVLSTWLDV